MARLSAPFVLLDDARPGGRATLFTGLARDRRDARPGRGARLPRAAARRAARPVSSPMRRAIALEAEAGAAAPASPAPDAPPLLWFGLFDAEEAVDAERLLPDPAGAWAGAPRPLISRAEYETALAAVKTHIEAGDIYQANLTFAAEVPIAGPPARALRGAARAGARRPWRASSSPARTGCSASRRSCSSRSTAAGSTDPADEGHRAARRRSRGVRAPIPSSAPRI